MYIKVYHSFGGKYNIRVTGHVFENDPVLFDRKHHWFLTNIITIINLFRVKTIGNHQVELEIFDKKFTTITDESGFFIFESDPIGTVTSGWHAIKINSIQQPEVHGEGKIFIPYRTSFSIISDIDDTVLKSYSASVFRGLFELLSKNPNERKLFDHTVEWYQKLAKAFPPGDETNAFFYVSSSEWNLYDYLDTIFKKHELPEGIFMLDTVKKLSSFFKTGKGNHNGKLDRMQELLKAFPDQKFVLIGDNTQKDPMLYEHMAQKYADNILAVFIRNKKEKNRAQTSLILKGISDQGIPTMLFNNTLDAIEKSKELGLIH